MFNTLFSAALKVRVALWAIDLALPSGSNLQGRFRSGLLGMMAAVAGGALVAFATAGLIGTAAYLLYTQNYLNVFEALLAAIGTLVVLSGLLFLLGKGQMERAFRTTSISRTRRPIPDAEDTIREIANGFLAGFLKDEEYTPSEKVHPLKRKDQR